MKNTALNPHKLSDVLVGVVDRVRRSVHRALGTRPWDVAVVTRRWSGGDRGLGNPTVQILELDPPPMIQRNTKDRQGPAGWEAAGEVIMSEVSLSYTEDEIAPKGDRATEVAYRLTEKLGTHQRTTWYVRAAAPVARRGDKEGDNIDWYMRLNEAADMGLMDEVRAS